MKDYKKDISPKYLLIALSVICIVLTLISTFFPGLIKPLRDLTGRFIAPMQEGVSDIGNWFDDKVQVFGDVKKLKEENEQLKNEVTNYQNELGKQEAELAELQDLRDLYDLDELYPDYNKTVARIFFVNSSGWFNEFYIDKGMNDGIYEGCNVICDEGLLGIIVESLYQLLHQ